MDEKLIGLDLSLATEEVIKMLLDDPPDEAIFSEIFTANQKRPDVLQILYTHSRTPNEINREAAKLLHLPVRATTAVVKAEEEKQTKEAKLQRTHAFLQRIQRLSVGERIILAVRGGKEVRNILIRDANKEVILKVLENPRISETEVEMIARNPAVPEEALRHISKKKEWIKKYPVMVSLISNPKTPPGISMPFVTHLRTRDLLILSRSKNIPDAVRNAIHRYAKIRKK